MGFEREKIETSYYADGEDAHCMKLNIPNDDDEGKAASEEEDEGAEVGEAGKKETVDKKGKKRKVRLGKHMGVQGLVEKDESKLEKTAT